ncbi:MAG: hypothetical protein GF308_12365 [Candidatus Heimdallarchaeota archaeon]|nr:hypothetical protein [Candidatus Heimdallarchaeota archaeon]
MSDTPQPKSSKTSAPLRKLPFTHGIEIENFITDRRGDILEDGKELVAVWDQMFNGALKFFKSLTASSSNIPEYIREKIRGVTRKDVNRHGKVIRYVQIRYQVNGKIVPINVFGPDPNISQITWLLELVTPPCEYIEELNWWVKILYIAASRSITKGYHIQPLGFNPFQEEYRAGVTCGEHHHLGTFRTETEKKAAYNMIRAYIPHIIAFTSTSPFVDSKPTGRIILKKGSDGRTLILAPDCIRSYRLKENTGQLGPNIPEYLPHVDRYFSQQKFSRHVRKEIPDDRYVDVSPFTAYDTIECRFMDTQFDQGIRNTIIVLLQALALKGVKYVRQNKELPKIRGNTLFEHRKRAIDFGMFAKFQGDPSIESTGGVFAKYYNHNPEDGGPPGKIYESLRALILWLRPEFQEIGVREIDVLPLLIMLWGTARIAPPISATTFMFLLYEENRQNISKVIDKLALNNGYPANNFAKILGRPEKSFKDVFGTKVAKPVKTLDQSKSSLARKLQQDSRLRRKKAREKELKRRKEKIAREAKARREALKRKRELEQKRLKRLQLLEKAKKPPPKPSSRARSSRSTTSRRTRSSSSATKVRASTRKKRTSSIITPAKSSSKRPVPKKRKPTSRSSKKPRTKKATTAPKPKPASTSSSKSKSRSRSSSRKKKKIVVEYKGRKYRASKRIRLKDIKKKRGWPNAVKAAIAKRRGFKRYDFGIKSKKEKQSKASKKSSKKKVITEKALSSMKGRKPRPAAQSYASTASNTSSRSTILPKRKGAKTPTAAKRSLQSTSRQVIPKKVRSVKRSTPLATVTKTEALEPFMHPEKVRNISVRNLPSKIEFETIVPFVKIQWKKSILQSMKSLPVVVVAEVIPLSNKKKSKIIFQESHEIERKALFKSCYLPIPINLEQVYGKILIKFSVKDVKGKEILASDYKTLYRKKISSKNKHQIKKLTIPRNQAGKSKINATIKLAQQNVRGRLTLLALSQRGGVKLYEKKRRFKRRTSSMKIPVVIPLSICSSPWYLLAIFKAKGVTTTAVTKTSPPLSKIVAIALSGRPPLKPTVDKDYQTELTPKIKFNARCNLERIKIYQIIDNKKIKLLKKYRLKTRVKKGEQFTLESFEWESPSMRKGPLGLFGSYKQRRVRFHCEIFDKVGVINDTLIGFIQTPNITIK